MRWHNERPIAKVNKGLAADSVFIFISLMAWTMLLMGFNFLLYWAML